jgi:hypothetical protein
MEFVEGFPHVNSKTVVLMVVNSFSMYAHFVPLTHPYTATTVARVFFDSIVWLHGIPSTIVSDHNLVFTSKFRVSCLHWPASSFSFHRPFTRSQTGSRSCQQGDSHVSTLPSRRLPTPVATMVGIGLNIVTTQRFTPRSRLHRFVWSTAVILLHYGPTSMARLSF